MRLSLLVAACLALAIVQPARALIRYDFEQPLFSDVPEPVLDHCVVSVDSLYHLFYLRGNPAVNIGHATTLDFVHWTLDEPVLQPGSWDRVLWAPYIVPVDGNWFMYYTGVNAMGAQQSGMAFSNDLANWFKFGPPVYHPDTSWAAWSETAFSHGRDPHIIEIDGTYYMFVTAQHEWFKGAVGCATSTDLFTWTDAGFIYMHENWHMLESVFMIHRDGLFHMFFTEEGVNGTTHMSSPTLFGGWNYSERHYIDAGHAPQITDTPNGPIFSRHSVYNDLHGVYRYVLRFNSMLWFDNVPAVPKPFPLQQQWTYEIGNAFYYQPTFANNAYARGENYPTSHVGDGWINTYELYTGPVGFGSPGQAQGDSRTGIIRSAPFSIQGNSISLLVGGGDFPDSCYVALVDHDTSEIIYSETGQNSNVMDRRYWDVSQMAGRSVHIAIGDLVTEPFGHICVDDIIESGQVLTNPGVAKGSGKKARESDVQAFAPGRPRLLANTPNPFNPTTTIHFELTGASQVRIEMYNAAGSLVRTLFDGARGAGTHTVDWDGTDRSGAGVASGVYFARLVVNGAIADTRKLMLLK